MNTGWKVLLISLIVAAGCVLLLRRETAPPRSPGRSGGKNAPRQRLVFYCAAGIKPPVDKVAREYESLYDLEIQIQYQGSGTLLSSLEVTRSGDLYLAADESYLDLARKKGLVAEVIPVARMRPVIGVAKGNPKRIRTLDDLLRPDVRVALGNPGAASIGRQTQRLLTAAGKWEPIKAAAVVMKPTVTEIANDLKLGAIDAGIIWDATANQYPEIDAVHIPAFDAAAKKVVIGVLTSCTDPPAALRFCRYLGAPTKGLKVFREFGYETVSGDQWAETPEILFYSGAVNRMAVQNRIRKFEEREGCRVSTVYNGCGILVGQMKAGARPDAYLSCDVSFMKQVADLFYPSDKVHDTRMVIVVPKGNPRGIKTLKDLARPGLAVGVANPKQSALGHLTERMLKQEGLLEAVRRNVRSQTPTADLLLNQLRAGKGSLDAVIVYAANCSQVRDKVDVIPLEYDSALAIQDLALSRHTKYPHLVSRLIRALESPAAKKEAESVGFHWRLPERPRSPVHDPTSVPSTPARP